MPSQWLTQADKDRLRAFPKTVSETELSYFYILGEADLKLVRSKRGDRNRLGFAVQLCGLRHLGFIPELDASIPVNVLRFLARQIGIRYRRLDGYGARDQTRSDHSRELALHLGFVKLDEKRRHDALRWLRDRALEHDRPEILLDLFLDYLLDHRIIRPGVTLLEKFVSAAREEAETHLWNLVSPMLDVELRQRIDGLLAAETPGRPSQLARLRSAAFLATAKYIVVTLDKISAIRDFGVQKWDMSGFNPNRLKALARLARTVDAQTIVRMPARRRFPLVVAFLWETLALRTDEAIDLFDRHLRELANNAERDLSEFRRSVADSTNEKVRILHAIGKLVLDPEIQNADLRDRIFSIFPREAFQVAIDDCARIERPLDDSSIDFLGKRAASVRPFAGRFLDFFEWKGTPETAPLLKAVAALGNRWAEGKKGNPDELPTKFLPSAWIPHVLGENGKIRKGHYEMCVLWELRSALRAGTVWIPFSRRYADPTGYLMPAEQWRARREEITRMVGLPEKAADRIERLAEEGRAAAALLEAELEKGENVFLNEANRPVLSRLEAQERPDSVDALDQAVADRLPKIDIDRLLIEVDRLSGFSSKLLNITDGKPVEPPERAALYAAILAQAGNFGFTRMAHMSGLSEDTLGRLSRLHFQVETLQRAEATIVNLLRQLPHSVKWGTGRNSASDGQRFPVSVKSTTARPLPKYFGYGRGLSVYSWTSDQYTQFGTKVIPVTLREATFVLDGILDNVTDLEIESHSTDTGGYTEAVFCFFDLLGMRFAPRIKNIGDQRLYGLGDITESRVRSMIRHRVRTDYIEQAWEELLRLAGTLKTGWAPASLLLTKIHGSSKKLPLIRGIQEYGRLVKTVFILEYLGDKEKRRNINRLLNKVESNQGLRQYLFCANEGKFTKHFLEEQSVQASCVSLVLNAVLYWNALYIQAAVNQIRKEGFLLNEDDLRYIAPNRFAHINMFGKYTFPIREEMRRTKLRPLAKPPQRIDFE